MTTDTDTKLADLAIEMKKKTDEVTELGRTLLADNEAGRKSTDELKMKADQALQEQGETRQRMTDLEQSVAKAMKSQEMAEPERMGDILAKHFENNADDKALLMRPKLGKSINIEMSRKALVNTTATGAALNYPGQQLPMVAPLLRRLTVRDLLMPGRTDKSVIFYPRETGFTSGAAIVAEGALKPESNITIENITQAVATIAHWTDISLQMLDDVPYIQSYVEGRGVYQLKLVEEVQLLNGSGVGGNLEGIYTAATVYAAPAGAPTPTQAIDKLRIAMLQVELANADTTGIVLHPTDWAGIELLKDGEARYLFTSPAQTTTGRLWGRDVVSTQAMTQGNFLVGDFMAHAQILDRQDANVAISFENKDNFVRNLATLRIEERLALAIYRPEAFVKGPLAVA